VLPGRSAATLDLIGRVISIGGVLLALAGAIVVAVARPAGIAIGIGGAVLVVVLVVGQVYRSRGSSRAREEAAHGYSTLVDVAGFDFRDGRTGQLIRSRDEEPMGGPSARVYDAVRRRSDDDR
jgi:hypothetical protein